jgi:hypothetical protein
MNRYVVRALIAVLTFCIGVAVGRGPHRARYKHERCHFGQKIVRLEPFVETRAHAYPGPFVSIDTIQADPMKLSYSSTTSSELSPSRQRVEFLIQRNSARAIASYTIQYESRSRNTRSSGAQVSHSPVLPNVGDTEVIPLECDSRETLIVWVSTIQFKDGTQWENPRHRIGQTNL